MKYTDEGIARGDGIKNFAGIKKITETPLNF